MEGLIARSGMRFFSTFFAVSSLFATGWAYASERLPLKTTVKTKEPPCEFVPSLDFLHDNAEAYSLKNVSSAAWFARSVQLVDDLRQQAWDSLPEKPIKVVDFNVHLFGLHATVLEFPDTVLVLYRGTEDAVDYVLNGTFYTTNGAKHGLPGWVHEGFLLNFRMSWPQVSATLKAAAQQGKSIVFASHSLGGVLSQFAAWLLENDGIKVSRIYAFQSPNAGDRQFSEEFNARFAGRSSNTLFGEDVTPHIPPIVESASAFGSALPKPLAGVAVNLLNKARYGASADRFTVSSNGTHTMIPADQVATSEIQYWADYLKKSAGKPFPLGLGANSPFVADHDIDKVLCSLTKSLN